MLLYLNEEYETIYWRSSMSHGAIIVWDPSDGPVKDLMRTGGRIHHRYDSPECLAYQCCPSPYSLKCVRESFAQEYGAKHPSPRLPPESAIKAVKDDIIWWKQLARDSERFARYTTYGAPKNYFMHDATVVLKEMWRRTLGTWNERHDDESVEMRLIRYLRDCRRSEYPRDLAEAVVAKLESMCRRRFPVCGDSRYDEADRLWELTSITPHTRLDENFKKRIQSLRVDLRRALKRPGCRPRVYTHLSADALPRVCSFAAPLFEALEADDPRNPSLNADKISEILGRLEDAITLYGEKVEKEEGQAGVRNNLAMLLHCRRSLHAKLTRGGYSISSDGYTADRQFFSYEPRS